MNRADPRWYKDAVIYQLHVRAFADANADGIGDFRGLIDKLDYLQDLGVTAIWLLPFYPSPLKDDGYDIADYTQVHPNYGTLRDFKHLLREAHARDLRVITELVLNHTSDEHPWFKRARRAAPGTPERDFYVWSDSPDRYRQARIIFKDFELSNWSWDPVAKAYYWHRFYHHQPDLNFDNPAVRKTMLQVVDHWLEMGVDGLRLDAVPYLYEREGTNCENLAETHGFLKELRAHVDAKFPGRMLLAEANQWPEDAVAYFGDGDECHTAFHFPVMPRLFMALQMEDRFPIIDILQQTPDIPEVCQWVLFLRNHDELTLEMVTDEERDYMYRTYARQKQARINLGIRRRLAPLLGNNRRRIELMSGLLLALPGTPVIYYGDEIGMGDNIFLGDRNGVRTPMQWSPDRNAGFSRCNPQQLYLPVIIDWEYHYEAVNTEAQHNNPSSLFWWTKRLIATRQQFTAFGRGSLDFLFPENPKVLAFIRRYENERILVVANLSRFSQYVELDLSEFQGCTPVDIFSRNDFPRIGELPYLLTLGPHSFYWFSLQQRTEVPGPSVALQPTEAEVSGGPLPELRVVGDWEKVFSGSNARRLERLLPEFLLARRWFPHRKARIHHATIQGVLSLGEMLDKPPVCLVLLRVEFADREPENYLIPLGFSSGEWAERMLGDPSRPILSRLVVEYRDTSEAGILHDVFTEPKFARALLDIIASRRRLSGETGKLAGRTIAVPGKRHPGNGAMPEPAVLYHEKSDRTIVYENRYVLKLLRRVEDGINPDLEMSTFLTGSTSFRNVPSVAGVLEYEPNGQPLTLGILKTYVQNEGDAWQYTLDAVGRFLESILTRTHNGEPLPPISSDQLQFAPGRGDVPAFAEEIVGPYLDSLELLGRRTAELHLALASEPENPDFAPEPINQFYRRSVYQSFRTLLGRTFRVLRQRLADFPEDVAQRASELMDRTDDLTEPFMPLLETRIDAVRIRCHGNFHLGRVLFTGNDFVFFNFEGEPARPSSERRIKRPAVRDVACMLRSLDRARHAALASQADAIQVLPDDRAKLDQWTRVWVSWAGAAFLQTYLDVAGDAPFIPSDRDQLRLLLNVHLLYRSFYELHAEIYESPEWIRAHLQGIYELMSWWPPAESTA